MRMGMGMGFYIRLIYGAFGKTEKCHVSPNSFSSRSAADPRKSVFHNVNQKRFYNSDIANLRRRCWYEDRRNLITLGLVGCGVVIPVYCWNLDTVPYGKRGHFVLVSNSLQNKIGESYFEGRISDQYKGKILDSHHPKSIRVNKILQDIIGALMRNKKQTSQFNWDIIVVDQPTTVDAHSTSSGKIIVFSGLLNYFKTDAEIATVIGHEVGHVVARHIMERKSVILWQTIFTVSMWNFFKNTFLIRLPQHLVLAAEFIFCIVSLVSVNRFCCRWHEMEADYIGLLISASAGYDPRIAPQVYYKFVENYTHPPGKKRAQLLSRPKVMEEALAIYTEALNDKDNE